MFSWLLIAMCTLSFFHILTTVSFLKHQTSSFFHHVALITISFQMILSESCHHRGTAVLKDDPSDAQTSYDLDVLNSKILHRHPRLTPMATPETWTAPKSFHC